MSAPVFIKVCFGEKPGSGLILTALTDPKNDANPNEMVYL